MEPSTVKKVYIVYLGSHMHGKQPTSMDVDNAKNSHFELLGLSLKSNTKKAKDAIFYHYTRNINGFAAMLHEEEAIEIQKHPDVISVFQSNERKLQTTRSWGFLGLETKSGEVPRSSVWNKSRFGEDVIIANLDSGVWPQRASFRDEGYGPVPLRWKGRCEEDKTDNPIQCNKKLIGARYFSSAARARFGVEHTPDSCRDINGHGTHSLTIAGGNFAPRVNYQTYAYGNAKGGSPKARLAAYKVCWINCLEADILAGFDAAISDGVDVISVAIANFGPSEFFKDVISIGAFHAVKQGIVVVCSAGNSGPEPGRVDNVSPWIITVGASTIDRLPMNNLKGTSHHISSTSNISSTYGKAAFAYNDHVEYPNLQLEKVRAPIMADFSSRGPNMVQPAILKPDITAPGVDILAAYSAYPRAISGGEVFRIRNGTSVSCSHVTGIVGLIRALYPDWSPAAIKSAIMTSATKKDNTNAFIQNESQRNATPFDYGAGHVHPSRAADPGLVYDLTAITIPDLQGRITVSRTVKNVGTPGKYSVIIKEPTGVSVYVNPRTLHFKETGEEKTFNVTLEVKADNNSSDYAFGYFTWLDGKHYVRSIIVVKLKL
ncbi:subtilisin-like protease SBT5.3 [Tripterygium wilfordii]|uniref:subtilisin-like protease SBT5.3 n=1 Tax=Tripterygium wilfordii TaxID=458696 RepID=UPI0018F7EAD8|nr:subtilisin-like protease SBT5.3 [Tripterygium wilfordii]XP_038713497.1 subtilisin-like protease SBT5.3 [Tripterygium wilfordii]XP_038713501.1 subtilisin-like protease SBT5.3 [Tripterygium wilfordii]